MEIQWADELRSNVWHWRIVDATATPIATCTANNQTADAADAQSIDANTESAASVSASPYAVPVPRHEQRNAMPMPGKCRHAVSTAAATAAVGLHGRTTPSKCHSAAKSVPLSAQKFICGKYFSLRFLFFFARNSKSDVNPFA